MVNFILNEERCIKCGKCVADCPPHCISMEKGAFPALQDESKCKRCQHCLAVCPTAAISILGCDPDDSMDLNHELPTVHSMETLIKGRRSVRSYTKQSLGEEKIRKLLETAWHAPTGTNAQSVLFTATMSREVTEAFATDVYKSLGRFLAENPEKENEPISLVYMRMAYGAYSEKGIDILFRRAPHFLIASAPKTVPVPREDCVIALTNFELLAQSSGVGAFWNGMMTWCLTKFLPELAHKINVPDDHEIGYCMSFGLPAVQYQRTVQRGPAAMNLLESY